VIDAPSRAIAALLGLTFVTGLIDAASVLGIGHVFVANMTGNVVFIGFSLLGEGKVSLLDATLAIPCFMLGALLGGKLGRGAVLGRLRVGFALDALGLFLAAGASLVGMSNQPIVALLSAAMGLRTALVRAIGVPDLPTTVLTLTLAGVGADSTWAGGNNLRWKRRLAAVAVLLFGACLGALLHSRAPNSVLLVAALAESVAALVLVARELQPSS
jgi:uncharacterized membrane protein YoaK (UPF0700 family)